MNFEMQQKYNMLKEKNRQRNAEIKYRENYLFMDCIKNLNAIQLSIISVVFCHREPLFFMPKNFKNITKNS